MITCEWVNTPIVSEGAVIGVMSMIQDVSERVAAAGALRRLNEELEQRVQDRTGALSEANATLREREVALREAREIAEFRGPF